MMTSRSIVSVLLRGLGDFSLHPKRTFRNRHHGGCWRVLKQMTEQASMAKA